MTRYGRVVIKLHVAGEVLAVARLGVQVAMVVGAKHGVDGVYSADPRRDPAAERFERLAYEDVIARDLRVMDPSAFILARASAAAGGCGDEPEGRGRGLPLHVFDVAREGAMAAIASGEDVGTTIAMEAGYRPTA